MNNEGKIISASEVIAQVFHIFQEILVSGTSKLTLISLEMTDIQNV